MQYIFFWLFKKENEQRLSSSTLASYRQAVSTGQGYFGGNRADHYFQSQTKRPFNFSSAEPLIKVCLTFFICLCQVKFAQTFTFNKLFSVLCVIVHTGFINQLQISDQWQIDGQLTILREFPQNLKFKHTIMVIPHLPPVAPTILTNYLSNLLD